MRTSSGAEAAASAAGLGTRRRLSAFGLDVDSAFDAPGLPAAPPGGLREGTRTRLDLAAAGAIDADWPTSGVERVLEERFDDGAAARTIDVHPVAGYRLFARHFGLARISPSGDRVVCAPPEDEAWSWQRFLVGRILPWAAVLRGYEVFHASAVGCGGRAVAFVGPTGAGKTSLAVQLLARGLEFFTDDVLSLGSSTSGLRAHPGAAIASVRPAERELIPGATWKRLGEVLGHSGKTYVEVPRAAGPAPLGAIYFLRAEDGPPVEPIPRPDPRLLLSSTFVVGVQTPARLINQLEVCSALAREVPLFALRVRAGLGAAGLAEAVHEHMEAQWVE
jgi:hypothetical protein